MYAYLLMKVLQKIMMDDEKQIYSTSLQLQDLSGMEVGSSEVAATAKVDPTSTPPPKPIRQKNWGASSAKSLDNTDSVSA